MVSPDSLKELSICSSSTDNSEKKESSSKISMSKVTCSQSSKDIHSIKTNVENQEKNQVGPKKIQTNTQIKVKKEKLDNKDDYTKTIKNNGDVKEKNVTTFINKNTSSGKKKENSPRFKRKRSTHPEDVPDMKKPKKMKFETTEEEPMIQLHVTSSQPLPTKASVSKPTVNWFWEFKKQAQLVKKMTLQAERAKKKLEMVKSQLEVLSHIINN